MLYIVNRYVCLCPFLLATYSEYSRSFCQSQAPITIPIGLSGFHGEFSDAFCQIPFDPFGGILANTTWAGVLALRVRALWLQKKYIVWSIYGVYICVMTSFIVTAGIDGSRTFGKSFSSGSQWSNFTHLYSSKHEIQPHRTHLFTRYCSTDRQGCLGISSCARPLLDIPYNLQGV